jgi:hypothetical protein
VKDTGEGEVEVKRKENKCGRVVKGRKGRVLTLKISLSTTETSQGVI